MTDLYPPESQKLDIVGHLEELRRRIFKCLIAVLIAALLLFARGGALMELTRVPLHDLGVTLIFLDPAEAFVAYMKVVLLAAFIFCFPYLLYQIYAFVAPALDRGVRKAVVAWLVLGLVLFGCGMAFAYFLALRGALSFLLSFGRQYAEPQLSLGRYVSFFVAFMLIGGLIFEIPVAMGFLGQIGFARSAFLKKKRPQALVVMLIAAAVITPTQDVFNMLLFAVPMYALYESGILVVSVVERKRRDEKSILVGG